MNKSRSSFISFSCLKEVLFEKTDSKTFVENHILMSTHLTECITRIIIVFARKKSPIKKCKSFLRQNTNSGFIFFFFFTISSTIIRDFWSEYFIICFCIYIKSIMTSIATKTSCDSIHTNRIVQWTWYGYFICNNRTMNNF